MEYVNDILCIAGAELIKSETNPKGVMSLQTYRNLVRRHGVKVVRRGCYGKPALLDFATLPQKYQDEILQQLGGVLPRKEVIHRFTDYIKPDADAISYYSNYRLSDGRQLPLEAQKEYAINASVLNGVKSLKFANKAARASLGKKPKLHWATMIKNTEAIRGTNTKLKQVNHTLPSKPVPLSRKFKEYIEKGYEALISRKYCNDNSRKVNDSVERLLLSLYCMPNKPFGRDVHAMYMDFIEGDIDVIDQKTGEVFKREDFIKNGEAITINPTTVWNYINHPDNRAIVDKARQGAHRFNSTSRPHHHRHNPNFSFSKISMDDRDLPRKCNNGQWVKAYYAYDVTSGCVIGRAYSLRKDERLFIDCMQDMFRLIDREGFGMPLQVEVENHLVNKFFDELNVMFPFVRICNPGNSQEKRAEHLNRAKKYGVERRTQVGIGRWWSKHDSYIVDRDKKDDEFVEKTYSLERLIADDMQACKDFNNTLHPKQNKYPGKTRWQVLTENINPNVAQLNKAVVYKGIGECTRTTIMRNQYVTVQYAKYVLPSIDILGRLLPNNYQVEAYYLPAKDGNIEEVYLYQQGVYLCKACKINTYNEANAEWTDADKLNYTEQATYVSQFDAFVKEGKNELAKAVLVNNKEIKEALEQPVVIVEQQYNEEEQYNDNILDGFDPEEIAKKALENL